MQKIIFVILVICGLTTAQIQSSGPCPKVQAQEDFELNKFLGVWNEIEKYPTKFQVGDKCIKSEFSLLSNQSVSFVYNGISSITSQPIQRKGSLKAEDGKFEFPKHLIRSKLSNFLVLGTDYDSYMVAYSCTENLNGTAKHNDYAWIMTRSIFPVPSVVEKARNVLINNGISVDYLTKSNQLRCLDY